MRAAELIVGRAWAEELLRRHGCMAFALDAAREACQDARGRLAAAQRSGDPRRINLAHDALEYAIEVRRASEAAGYLVRRALEAALDRLERATGVGAVSATAGRAEGDGPGPADTSASAAPPDPSIRRAPPRGEAPRAAWRALWRVGSLRARRAPDPAQP